MDRLENHRHATYLLDHDPDLAEAIPPDEYEEARRRSVVHVLELDGPAWDPAEVVEAAGADWLGMFVIDGLLIRRVSVAGRTACEIFGAGDLCRPWDEDGEYEPLAIEVDWLVLRTVRLAVLDRRFALRMARWPSVSARLLQRVASRARNLAVTQAVTHLPRTHARLLLLFWLLAERWGTVGREGVVVKLPLTHSVLAMLVGSHRPTVTIALQKLARSELLVRQSGSRWLLTSKGIECLHDPGSLSLIGGAADAEEEEALDVDAPEEESVEAELHQIVAESHGD